MALAAEALQRVGAKLLPRAQVRCCPERRAVLKRFFLAKQRRGQNLVAPSPLAALGVAASETYLGDVEVPLAP